MGGVDERKDNRSGLDIADHVGVGDVHVLDFDEVAHELVDIADLGGGLDLLEGVLVRLDLLVAELLHGALLHGRPAPL